MTEASKPATTERAGDVDSRVAKLTAALTDHRAAFVGFVEARVRDRATAEDVVSEALIRALPRIGEVHDDGAVLAWFYRALRNAVVDHYRQRGTADRGLELWAAETDTTVEAVEHAGPRVCRCVTKVAASLKPEYSDALQRIEVDGDAVRHFAAERGISSVNAAVRVFRAREALRRGVIATCGECAQGGCVDCTCDA